MLTLLKIRNLALVDSLTWNIGSGLIGVTGETGAGKSVIVGALKLILGERADKGMIRTGESSCSVEALFELSDESEIWGILEAGGSEVDREDGLIIRRVIGGASNRQFINNSPVTLSLLKQVGTYLVDLHGPHDHQSLLANDRQLGMLDAFADAGSDYVKYREVYADWLECSTQLETLRNAKRTGEQELELLKFQLEEIDAAELQPEEEEKIEERYRRASNSSKLIEHAGGIGGILASGLTAQLAEIQRLSRELERLDPATCEMLSGVDGAVMELQELEVTVTDYASAMELDPAELMQLEQRINVFETLKRKYGPSLEDVLKHGDEVRGLLENVDGRGEAIETLQHKLDALTQKVADAAAKLSAKRKKRAPKLAKEIASHLKDLGFRQADFTVKVESLKKPGAHGSENVDFQFGPNPGEPLKPLKNIASSGEISRVMLAAKSALAQQDFTPLMVFDEIDANVGGEIARAVGEKMAVLGRTHQVISITHFPQVAAVAQQHFVVEKSVLEGRSVSGLTEVEGEQRINELVRMLGAGDNKEAREMATSLLAK